MKSTPFKEYFSERKFNNAKIILSSVKSVGLNSRLQRVWQFSSWRRKKSFIYSSWSEDLLKVVCNFTFDTSSEVKIRCVWYFDEKLIPNDENIKHKKYFNTITIIKNLFKIFVCCKMKSPRTCLQCPGRGALLPCAQCWLFTLTGNNVDKNFDDGPNKSAARNYWMYNKQIRQISDKLSILFWSSAGKCWATGIWSAS